jgi:hypothetical protein
MKKKQRLLNFIDLLIWIFIIAIFTWNLLSTVPRFVWGIAVILMAISIAIKIKRLMNGER